MTYTKLQLKKFIALAKQLGFQDDVDHWTAELKKLEEGECLSGALMPEHLKNLPTCSICGLQGHWIAWVSDKNAWRCINHVYDEEPKEKTNAEDR